MEKELYYVYEGDYSDRNNEFISTDINLAVKKAMDLNSKDFCIYVDVFKVNGGKIYSENFTDEDNMTSEALKDSLVNKTNEYWNC